MVNGHKIDENRNRKWKCLLKTFLLIHASDKMRDGDFNNCRTFMESRQIANVELPRQEQVQLGGFVGVAYCDFAGDLNTYRFHNVEPDRFFTGPFAYRLKCRPIDFIPASGMHGLWIPALTQEQWDAIVEVIKK